MPFQFTTHFSQWALFIASMSARHNRVVFPPLDDDSFARLWRLSSEYQNIMSNFAIGRRIISMSNATRDFNSRFYTRTRCHRVENFHVDWWGFFLLRSQTDEEFIFNLERRKKNVKYENRDDDALNRFAAVESIEFTLTFAMLSTELCRIDELTPSTTSSVANFHSLFPSTRDEGKKKVRMKMKSNVDGKSFSSHEREFRFFFCLLPFRLVEERWKWFLC